MSTFHAAYSALVTAQKTSRGVSLYSRWVNRPLGRVLAAAAHQVGLGPNTVTILSAVCTGAALLVLVGLPAGIATGLLISTLLVLGFALDSADGQVARLTGTSSPGGEWLDHIIDAVKMVALHGAVTLGWWRHTDLDAGWLLVPMAYQVVAVTMFSGGTIAELLLRQHASHAPGASTPSTARAVALLPADFGVLALCMLLWGFTDVFVAAYTTLLVLNALILMALLAKWFHALSRLASQREGLLARGTSPEDHPP